MKFQRLEAFENNLVASFPGHLSPIYMVVCPDNEERDYIYSTLVQRFETVGDLMKSQTLSGALKQLASPSLFNDQIIAAFESSSLTKGESDQLSHYIKHLNPNGRLILALGKAPAQIYNQGKKEMVFLDLTAEKPWDKKDRLKKWAFQRFSREKKTISPDALDALFERLPPDRLLIENEIDKLLCFIGEKPQITRADITAICCDLLETNLFQLADELVWGQPSDIPIQNDLSKLLPLIGILRNLFEMGLKMSALLKRGASSAELAGVFPKLRSRALEKNLSAVKRKGENHFSSGLKQLFELELGLKTSLGTPELLFTQFCAKIL